MLTTILVTASSVLATLAIVLLAVLVRGGRSPRSVDAPTPRAQTASPPPPRRQEPAPPTPRRQEPAPSPAPVERVAPFHANDPGRLARDLHGVVATYRETPRTAEPAPSATRTGVARETPRPADPAPRASSAGVASEAPRSAEPAPRGSRTGAPHDSHDGPAGSAELQELLAQTLETVSVIPGADGALVAVTVAGEPIIGTLGLARHEADRLAATLPEVGNQTRSITIAYEYEDDPRLAAPHGRIERGIAVPVPGVHVPALIAILTRAPAANLGEPQVELLEEVARRFSPALSAVLDVQATATPVSISVREVDRESDAGGGRSAEREKRRERGQVDWLGRG